VKLSGGARPRSRRDSARRFLTTLLCCAAASSLPYLAPYTSQVSAAAPTVQQTVDIGVRAAAADGIAQHVALVDRTTGRLVASHGGEVQVVSESVVKLFTVAYYLVRYDGTLPDPMSADLREMIIHSNDVIESRYWTTQAVPAMAARYDLQNTSNGAKTGPNDWGWEYITADDEARFLYRASKDPMVGPFLMSAMAGAAPTAADGFDQHFGFNALAGDHGSKQGWTDLNTTAAINVHSVGWTPEYFGAVLQTAESPDYDVMRKDATATVGRIAAVSDTPAPVPDPAAADRTRQLNEWVTISAAAGRQVASLVRVLLRWFGLGAVR